MCGSKRHCANLPSLRVILIVTDCLTSSHARTHVGSPNFWARLSVWRRVTLQDEFAAPLCQRLPAWYTRADCAGARLCHSPTPTRAVRVFWAGVFLPCCSVCSEPTPSRSRPACQRVCVAEDRHIPPTHVARLCRRARGGHRSRVQPLSNP
jgi:hypothetical protein